MPRGSIFYDVYALIWTKTTYLRDKADTEQNMLFTFSGRRDMIIAKKKKNTKSLQNGTVALENVFNVILTFFDTISYF